jgi:DNA-binding GntR family transcriptional regulator
MNNPAVSTIADRLFIDLRTAIVEGRIPAGSKLSEPELAGRFGTSRAPLREALGRLEAHRLVERRPNAGYRVVTLSARELLEIYQIREALEGMAARLAAQNMTEAGIEELYGLLDEHGRQVARESGQVYFQQEGDPDFHYRLVHGSGNQRLVGLLCQDLYHLMRMYRFQFGMAGKRAEPALVEHRHILDAVASRDGEMAELLMRHHIRESRRNVERLIDQGRASWAKS